MMPFTYVTYPFGNGAKLKYIRISFNSEKTPIKKMFTTHYEIKIALSVQQTKLLKLLLEVHTKLSF